MSIALWIGLIVSAQQEPTTTLNLNGVRILNAGPTLAQAFHVQNVEIGKSIANDVLLVRAKDVDPALLRDKIATTLNATWQPTPTGWRLEQTNQQVSQDLRIYNDSRKAEIARLLSSAKKKVSQSPALDSAFFARIAKLNSDIKKDLESTDRNKIMKIAKEYQFVQAQSPVSRLLCRILAKFTPEMLTRANDNNPRIVFSSQPTAAQMQLPLQINDALKALREDSKAWVQGMKASNDNADDSGGILPEATEDYSQRSISTVLLTFRSDTIAFGIQAYDADGTVVFQQTYNMSEEDWLNSDFEATSDLNANAPKLTLSKLATEFQAQYNLTNNDYNRYIKRAPLSPEFIQTISTPETIDPLSIATSEVVLATIKEPNVVAILDDSMLSETEFEIYPDSKTTTDTYTQIRKDGWFQQIPVNPIELRNSMMNRSILGPIIRFDLALKGPKTLEQIAKFRLSLPWAEDQLYTYLPYINMIPPGENEPDYASAPYRIFGSLSPSQLEAAKTKGLDASLFSSSTTLEIFRSIFYDEVSLGLVPEPEDEPGQKRWAALEKQYNKDIYYEPTVGMPNGITSGMRLEITENSETGILCLQTQSVRLKGGNNGSAGGFWDFDSIGDRLFKQTKPERYGSTTFEDRDLQIGQKRTVIMRLYVSPIHCYQWNISHTFVPDPKLYNIKTLPQKYQDMIQAAYKEAEQYDKENGAIIDEARQRIRKGKNVPPQ